MVQHPNPPLFEWAGDFCREHSYTRPVPKTPFISLTSTGGNIGRIHWVNTIQLKGFECIWGAWWFKQAGTQRLKINDRPMLKAGFRPLK